MRDHPRHMRRTMLIQSGMFRMGMKGHRHMHTMQSPMRQDVQYNEQMARMPPVNKSHRRGLKTLSHMS